MSANTASAIKAHLEGQGLGVAVFRDRRAPKQDLPYITVREDISTVPDGQWNPYADPEGHVSEVVQVDIWQRRQNPGTEDVVESYTLADAVMKSLHGSHLPTAPKPVSGVQVISRNRIVEFETNTVHTALTVQVRRTLATSNGHLLLESGAGSYLTEAGDVLSMEVS